MSRGLALRRAGRVATPVRWTPDTRFGKWFQRTWVWKQYVVAPALDEFERMLGARRRAFPVVLDAGCGAGVALGAIERRFGAERIVAVDVDPDAIDAARAAASACACGVELRVADLAAREALPEGGFDLVLCHQTLHHVEDQVAVLRNLRRALKPGGVLLLAESCRVFTASLRVRALFRHPGQSQRTAEELVALVRAAGFELAGDVATPDPFWSRWDFGAWAWLGLAPRARRALPELQLVALA